MDALMPSIIHLIPFFAIPFVIVLVQSLITVRLCHCNPFLTNRSALKPALIILLTQPTTSSYKVHLSSALFSE